MLWQWVLADLWASLTPRRIARRLKLEAEEATVELMRGSLPAGGVTAAREAISQFIYAMPRGELVRHGIFLRSRQGTRTASATSHVALSRGQVVGGRAAWHGCGLGAQR